MLAAIVYVAPADWLSLGLSPWRPLALRVAPLRRLTCAAFVALAGRSLPLLWSAVCYWRVGAARLAALGKCCPWLSPAALSQVALPW